MSKRDMLGPIIRALVGLPTRHHGLILAVVHGLSGENGDAVHQSVAAALRDKPAPLAKPSTLIFLKKTELDPTSGKKTAECLVGSIYGYRDPDIDSWLPEMQPARGRTNVIVYDLGDQLTFMRMFRPILKVGKDMPVGEIGKLLKERKHTLTLPQLDALVEKQEGGEDVGLRTDGYANFVPVENADGTVSVVYVIRHVGRWDRDVYSLGNDDVWDREDRLLVSNSDASNL